MFISTQYVETCFCIKGEGGVGTAFAIKIGEISWLVTAKHNIGGGQQGDAIFLRMQDGWLECRLAEIRKHASMDVCVFQARIPKMVAPGIESDPTASATFGQRVIFLGFPHGLSNTHASEFGLLTPLCRNAFFSGVITENNAPMIVLDGFNNPGYSGSPVWYSEEGADRCNLLGLISGYRVEERSKSSVYEELTDGTERKIKELFVKPNSGMIYVVPVMEIKNLIS